MLLSPNISLLTPPDEPEGFHTQQSSRPARISPISAGEWNVVETKLMSWHPDMSTHTPLDEGENIRAVGWLSAEHPFPAGEVPADFLARLQEFERRWVDVADALHWGIAMGFHTCELCGDYHHKGNLGVPSGELLYVAPAMLAHYVEVHHYRPPEAFIAALVASPLPGTKEYYAIFETYRHRQDDLQQRWRSQLLQDHCEQRGER